jgi:Ser/Thr protein kinase RdoA (MazF antagonist)
MSALSEIHEIAGVCHGDVKADNVMVVKGDNEEYPVLIDFGKAFIEGRVSEKKWITAKLEDMRDAESCIESKLASQICTFLSLFSKCCWL